MYIKMDFVHWLFKFYLWSLEQSSFATILGSDWETKEQAVINLYKAGRLCNYSSYTAAG